MPKLSESQTVLLCVAAARPDRSILPAPETLKGNGPAFERTLKALLRQGLIAQSSAGDAGGSARSTRAGDGADQIERLVVTSAGLDAIGIAPDAADDGNPAQETAPDGPAGAKPQAARPSGKMGLMVDMVSQGNGATIGKLAAQAGWLPHTTRAALTRLRQRGFDIRLAAAGDRRAYRLGPIG